MDYQSDILKAAQAVDPDNPHNLVARMVAHADAGSAAQCEARNEANDRRTRQMAQLRASNESFNECVVSLRLALDFGVARGWTLTQKDFGLRTLAEGKMHGGGQRLSFLGRDKNPDVGRFFRQFDHSYFYRRKGKAAAIAPHLYALDQHEPECRELAQRFGLTFEVPDFPTWWDPGPAGTTLVVYIGPAGS